MAAWNCRSAELRLELDSYISDVQSPTCGRHHSYTGVLSADMQQANTTRSSTDSEITEVPGRGKGRVVQRKGSLALVSSTTADLAVAQSDKARCTPTQLAPALELCFRHYLTTAWGRQGQQDEPRYSAWLQSGMLPILDLARPQHAETLRTTMRAGDPVATQRHSFCRPALCETWTTEYLVRTAAYG